MGQVIQITGSLLVLAGFALAQRGIVDVRSPRYLVLNLVGSAALAAEAVIEQQWGFLLLEGVWAIVSAVGVVSLCVPLLFRNTAEQAEGPMRSSQAEVRGG